VKENEEMERKNYLQNLRIPDEPGRGDNTITLRITFPTGNSLVRKFYDHQPLQHVKDFIDTRELEENGGIHVPRQYDIVTDFPRRVFSDFNSTLKELGFQKTEKLRIQPE